MEDPHSILRRQARRAGIDDLSEVPDRETWLDFLDRINQSYESADRDRYLLERSLEVSSDEMRQLSDQLRHEKEVLMAVLGALSTGIIHLDANWEIQFVNPAGLRLLHAFGDDDFEGQPIFESVTFEFSGGGTITRTEVEPALEGGQPWWEDDCVVRRRDDTTFPGSIVFNPMRHGEDLVGVVLTVRDISQKKRAARAIQEARVEAAAAERARQAQAAFLANMSHELRTPLNAIIGYSELVVEDAEDLDYTQIIPDLNKIRGAGRHLLSLINDVLDMSKIQAGRLELELGQLDLGDVIREVADSMEAVVEKSGNTLHIEVADDLPSVETDPTKLRQALINLVGNAGKFTEGGDVTIAAEGADGGEAVRIAVTDTGIGIDPDKIDDLFEAFVQADTSTTRRYGGTGLGLTITQAICETLGAQLEVESEPGEGSTFSIKLPTVYDAPELDEESSATDLQEETFIDVGDETAQRTVLLIDDDPATHDLVRRYLEGDDTAVISAFSGSAGLRKARAREPDAIVLDVILPDMEGWDVLSELKRDPETANIPLLVVSIVADKSTAFELGASDYLVKPVDRNRLRQILTRYWLDDREQRVLIVEDDEALRELLHRKIEKDGWEVQTAVNGKDAYEYLEAGPLPDLILLDLMMPEMDGFELLRITHGREEWAEIPVVVVTAMELTQAQRRGLQRHVEQIVAKHDHSTDDMLGRIAELVEETLSVSTKRLP